MNLPKAENYHPVSLSLFKSDKQIRTPFSVESRIHAANYMHMYIEQACAF